MHCGAMQHSQSRESFAGKPHSTHYLPLDSIRGIAAFSVVIHHFVISKVMIAEFTHKAWIDYPFFHNAWLFVDLFFVLSGIVISLNYAKSDFGNFSFKDFLARRLARIYPLHVVTLAAMVALRFGKMILVSTGVVALAPSAADVNTVYSFVLNLLLLHSMGFLNHLSWNGPSWSISTEFYTYILFAALLVCSRRINSTRFFWLSSVALVVACWVVIVTILGKGSLDFHYDYGFLRCVMSFFIGVLTLKFVRSLPPISSMTGPAILQLGSLFVSLLLVSIVGTYPGVSFVAPFAFAMLLGSLMAFPMARPLPSLLSTWPLVWLGKRSYSIYLTHAVVLVVAEYAVQLAGARPISFLDGLVPGLAASISLLLLAVAVLGISALSYEFVELRGGRLLLRVLKQKNSSSAAVAARVG